MRILPLIILACASAPLAFAQNGPDVLDAPELLCAIQNRLKNASQGIRGTITCSPDESGADLFFLGRYWKGTPKESDGCNCDFDHDGLTACEEVALCIDPGDRDTDDDCILDGQEILNGSDPRDADSDDDGIIDGEEDLDGNGFPDGTDDADVDGLTNCQETQVGTDPLDPDTDDDGWNDGVELETDDLDPISDPLDPESVPELSPFPAGFVSSTVIIPRRPDPVEEELNTAIPAGFHSATVIIPRHPDPAEEDLNTAIPARVPPTTVIIPGSPATAEIELNTTISHPPVEVRYE